MPQRMLPFTPLTKSTPVIRTPMSASSTVMPSLENIPFATDALKEYIPTRVALSTTMWAFCRPMNAINRPIPADTAYFKFIGIELKICSRTLVRDRARKMIPSTNTAASAISQVYPMERTTV